MADLQHATGSSSTVGRCAEAAAEAPEGDEAQQQQQLRHLLRPMFDEAAGCSDVVGGPLDPGNHFDRLLVAGKQRRCCPLNVISVSSHPGPVLIKGSRTQSSPTLRPFSCAETLPNLVPAGALIARRMRAAVHEQLQFTCRCVIMWEGAAWPGPALFPHKALRLPSPSSRSSCAWLPHPTIQTPVGAKPTWRPLYHPHNTLSLHRYQRTYIP